jgi:hypothetical protein
MHCYLGKRKGSDKWYIYQYDERTGQCPRFSTRTADRAEAEKKLAEHILKLPHRQIMNDATLVKIMLRYWEHHGQHTFAKDTVRATGIEPVTPTMSRRCTLRIFRHLSQLTMTDDGAYYQMLA